jgi:hypothetical protein
LTKTSVLALANDLIADTEYWENLKAYKEQCKIPVDKLGGRWYTGFMTRQEAILRCHKTRIKDVKQRTWVTEENFAMMYDNVYEAMVEAGVAVRLEAEVGSEGGRPTKYQLVRPEFVLFVNETGCNTNQKDDGHVGSELFVLPVVDSDEAPTGATTDIHFTVLAFLSATGNPVMCAVIFKSNKHVSEIPISWKLGLDITKPLHLGETLSETLALSSDAMEGGPTCRYNGIEVQYFFGTSPKASITSELLMSMLQFLDGLHVFTGLFVNHSLVG